MRMLIVLILLWSCTLIHAQDTTYLSKDSKRVYSKDSAAFIRVRIRDSSDTNRVTEHTQYISGRPCSEKNFINFRKSLIDGVEQEWFESGQLKMLAEYNNGGREGRLLTYWENGQPRRIETFKADKSSGGNCFDINGKAVAYIAYEVEPAFGSNRTDFGDYFSSHLVYPEDARKQSVEGKVVVRILVSKTGAITNTMIQESVHPLLDEEALRCVRAMPAWHPAMQDGEPIGCWLILPVVFKLR